MDNLPEATTAESKAKMLEILQRMQEEEEGEQDSELDSDDESEDCLGLSERLAGVNLDDTEKVWEKLTDNEKRDFEAFLRYVFVYCRF